ncbi:DUF692 domain-containing protein [Pleionea sp. CnH1-48]|uniref:HvfB family MNIO-type RiPP peptide maturase n=1 Tax=Pleionea sp. CnH1-48 TaxID=2954494 RepID=UPI002097B90F|nr:DUF692 domain-containing protein [Pleionea sp. CnH1-48]MCO7223609.1 DUF692 domain-containing protein [Pleionea sp. CnH1-48]
MTSTYPVSGSGLGLRRDLMAEMAESHLDPVSFMEVAPENWIGIGGPMGRDFKKFTERFPFVFHGLSLSIGSPAGLDTALVKAIKQLMDEHGVECYTEHLTYCSDDGHLYDLMPIPFTEEAVHYVADRIRQVQDILERPIAMENASYYAAPHQEMSEIDFINAVIAEADCQLLLDVNNIYVNSINHRYDPVEFLKSMPGDRVVYGHIAGHYDEADDLKVDTHGADVKPDVWKLLEIAYQEFGVFPTLLERDFNFPPMDELLAEVQKIKDIQDKVSQSLIAEQQVSHG